MSFSCTEQCSRCRGTGTITFLHPGSRTRGQIDCSTCGGTGTVTYEVK